MKDKETRIEFKVIDNNTGKEADIGKIALKEDWAKGLMYCDMQGFAILDDGNLVLLDECGKYEYCPSERFSIKFENSVVLSREEYERLKRVENEKDRLYEIKLDLENQLIEKGWTDYEGADEIEKRVSKETAEKIYKKIKDSFLMNSKNRYALKLWLKEQFGVEIKE